MKSTVYHGEVDIEYAFVLAPNPSNTLIIAFPGAGNSGFDLPNISLNYMMTIGQFNANALYIQTNKDYSKSYLRCINRDFKIERSIKALIDQCIDETNSTQIIAVGSSMGGFCALYYGLKYDWDIIAGSLSPYVLREDSSMEFNLLYACGGTTHEDKKWYDNLILNVIQDAGARGYNKKLFMSWGEGEVDWVTPNQAPKLLEDLDSVGIKYKYRLYPFSNHLTVSASFPNVLKAYLGYYLGLTDEPIYDKAESLEQELMRKINENYSSLLPQVKKLSYDKENLDIKGVSLYGETNIQTCLRNFCYIQQGWYWRLNTNEPVNIKDKDLFWGNLPQGKIREAVCFYFQSGILYLYEKKEIPGALEWCVENARQYVMYVSHVAEPKQNNDWWNATRRMNFFIELRRNMDKCGIKADWTDRIIDEIINDLRLIVSSEDIITDGIYPYKHILGLLTGITYFKNNTDFFTAAYNTAIDILCTLTDYCFDKNGVCIIRQMRHQNILVYHMIQIMRFIEANGFPQTKNFKAFQRKYSSIIEFTAHITNPGGNLAAIGHTTYAPAYWIRNHVKRKPKNIILKSSNIAILEDKQSLSYITVSGSSNIHSVYRHCDLLSFTWFYDGKQVFADSEGGGNDLADFARSSIAHNGLICDDIDYITPDYDDWSCINSVDEQEDFVFISMHHALISGVMLKRHLFWIKPNVIVLVDEADSENEHTYTQNFVLENYHVDKSDIRKVKIKADSVNASIVQFSAENGNYDLKQYNGTTDVNDTENYRGSLITDFTSLRKGLNLAYSKKGAAAKFLTAIECHSKNVSKSEVSVKNITFENFVITVELTNGKIITEEVVDD